MKPLQAAQLFIETLNKNNKKITGKDVLDLIIEEKHYPIKRLRGNHKTSRIFKDQLTAEFIQEVSFKLDLLRTKTEALSYHDLFRQLSGNPTSIVILASAIANKFVKAHTLAEIYKKAIIDKNEINQGITSDEREEIDTAEEIDDSVLVSFDCSPCRKRVKKCEPDSE